MLEHISAVDVVNAPDTPIRSFCQLLDLVREHDEPHGLAAERSIVEKRPGVPHVPRDIAAFSIKTIKKSSECPELLRFIGFCTEYPRLIRLRITVDKCLRLHWEDVPS